MNLRQRGYLEEWQLWVHPYPTMIKNQSRVNPSLVPYKEMLSDEDGFVWLSDLIEAKRKHTPPQLKRCVRAIAKESGGDSPSRADISRAFAICTKQLQKGGYLKKGSQEPTKKGSKRGRSKAHDKEHAEKLADYEKMLAGARKGEE
jgi:hypothetical protein